MNMNAALARLFPPLPLPHEMREWDAAAMRLGIPEELLMENAARAAFDVLHSYFPRLEGKRVWLLMGGGNNGGDAACLARHLLDDGAEPLVLHTRPLGACKGACGKHVRIARAAGVAFQRCGQPSALTARAKLEGAPHIVVDGLLGTGFSGALRPDMLELVHAVNCLSGNPFVLAIDVPSGLNAATGRPMPEAIQASATVSFAAAKPGLLLPEAHVWTGTVHARRIGIPVSAQREAPCSVFLADAHCLENMNAIAPGSFKNSYGHVLVVGGAPGFGGAAHLAARAALRAGAGLVTAAAPVNGMADIKNGWSEIMTLPLGESTQWPKNMDETHAQLAELVARCATLVVGPGMGRGEDAAKFLKVLLEVPHRPPTIFDADSLVLLARAPALLARITEQDILTPHPGEAAALLGCAAQDVQSARQESLERLCALCRGVVVLKGAGTLVGQAHAPTLLCPYDVPQLAVGGSGDVLAGCIGGLLASRTPERRHEQNASASAPAPATLALTGQAVALHALAGKSLAKDWPLRGNTASATADALPHALAQYAATEPENDILPWPR